MTIKKLLLILIVLITLNAFSASAWQFVGTAWNATFDTGNPESTQAVAVDTQDNVIVTGIVNQDFVTVKFNSAGIQQWNDTYDISGIGSTDQARGVAADSSDNVYVTGNGGSPQNIATVKYTSGGVRAWTSFYNSGASFESGRDVVVDSQGDIIITGYGGSAPDFITIKYNTTGGQQWVSTLDIGSHDQARGIAVDSQDNIVVAGQSNVSGANDFIVVKYNSAGIQLWNTSFDTGFPDSITGIAVDSTDNIYISGYQTTSAQREDYVTVKFNSSGSYIWNQTINKSLRDLENGVAVDNNDNVIVTGQSGVGGAYDYFTMFFYPNSTQQFNTSFDAGDDLAVDVATDSQNSILVAGLSDSVSASGNDDYFVLKYLINPSCGQVLTGDTVLNQDLNCTGSAVIINSSDVVFDCNGYSINGPGTGVGIKVLDNENITVRNCGINSFAAGVDVDPSWNVTIENSYFANMTTCVYINQSNWTLVKNNTFYNCSYAVRVLTGSYNNITDNTINLTGEGILLELNSFFNTIHANQIYNISLFGSNKGIHVKRSHNTTVSNNLVRGGKAGAASAIDIDRENVFQAQNNTVRNNMVINAGPIVMSGTRWNLAEFNNITRSTGMGLWIDERYHEIRNNTVYNCSTDGIDLSSGYTNVSGNIIWGNGDDGIDIKSDVNNSVFRNTVYNNTGNGIIIDNGVDDHDLINNTVYGNGRNGVLIQAAGGPGTDNRVIGNEIYNNSLNGVYLFQVNQEFVLDNNISSNGLAGIALANTAAFNNISGNTVKNHTYSINLTNADFNTIYDNYFEGLPVADAASTGNSWNITKTLGTNIISGPFLGGNFWVNYNGSDLDSDGLGDTFLPWQGLTNGIVNGGDFHPLTFIYVKDIQCEFNSSGSFLNCNNATFFANITRVRVNCTSKNGIVSNATFNLTNLFDSKTFFVNTTSTVIGGYYVLDNPDVQILDSGNWTLKATCTNTSGAKRNDTAPFFIPFGTVSGSVINPPGNTNVQNGSSFNVTCRMQCTGGECVNVNVTLDPINPNTNLTQPTQPVHAVYADSQFIYGASEDNGVYVWNKTGLGLFAVINTSMPNRAVFADSQYIYAGGVGGVNGNLTIYNRTDLATPFASVVNKSFPGGVYGIKSDNNYIYAAGGFPFGGPGFVTVYNKSTFASVVNITYAGLVRGIDIDNASIYAVSHACEVNVTSIAGFAPVTNLSVPAGCSQAKSVSVDDTYIIVAGVFAPFGPSFAWARVYNKTSYASVFNWTDATRVNYGLAAEIGGPDFAYYGGRFNSGGFPPVSNGFLNQLNKTSLALNDSINITNWTIKGLYCDGAYLYAAAGDLNAGNGQVMLFNNSCGGPAPPAGIFVNSLVVRPVKLPVPGTAHCSANVTTAGVMANVTFNVTFPGGGSLLLPGTNVGGDIFNSSNFTVSSTGLHVCTVFANNTNGSAATRSRNFYAGNKGIIPMNSGSPFYTINQNPRYPANQSCLNSTIPGNDCDSSWNVSVNGTNGTTWQFFCIYESAQSGDVNTSRIDITIGQQPPPPPPPAPSGGGGGGGATRAWQQEEAQCVESWVCEPWGECKFGEMTRICVDLNACGTTGQKPSESMPCKEEVVEEPAAVIEEKGVEKVRDIEQGPTTVVENPEPRSWNDIFSDRNFLRAALLVLVAAILVYLFALSGWLSKRPVVKRDRMSEAAFKPKKPPEKLPEDTEELLKELGKL